MNNYILLAATFLLLCWGQQFTAGLAVETPAKAAPTYVLDLDLPPKER